MNVDDDSVSVVILGEEAEFFKELLCKENCFCEVAMRRR